MEYCTSFWLELKVSDAKKPPLSKFQLAWHKQHHDAGGSSWILQRTQKEERLKLFVGAGVRNVPAWLPVLELPVPTSRSRCENKLNVYEKIFNFIKERTEHHKNGHILD